MHTNLEFPKKKKKKYLKSIQVKNIQVKKLESIQVKNTWKELKKILEKLVYISLFFSSWAYTYFLISHD